MGGARAGGRPLFLAGRWPAHTDRLVVLHLLVEDPLHHLLLHVGGQPRAVPLSPVPAGQAGVDGKPSGGRGSGPLPTEGVRHTLPPPTSKGEEINKISGCPERQEAGYQAKIEKIPDSSLKANSQELIFGIFRTFLFTWKHQNSKKCAILFEMSEKNICLRNLRRCTREENPQFGFFPPRRGWGLDTPPNLPPPLTSGSKRV